MIATTFTGIAVGDGELTLFFEDLGGLTSLVTVAGLEIVG